MNKSALKSFATEARLELLKKIQLQARKLGITPDAIQTASLESSDAIFIDGKPLSDVERKQRNKLITRVNEIGYDRVIEEAAYTWFNRFIALRYMEVNDYLPTKVRVLSSVNPDSTEPDMFKEALNLDLPIDKEHVYNLKIENNTDELFEYLIKVHCNDLNRYMPFMFETIEGYMEVLFPKGLLGTDTFVRKMTDVNVIAEEDWTKVEVVGWLYQYYISEENERVIKAKKKYKKEEIPFATQLFTPEWIVKYVVQNSLGRYWVESHPEHSEICVNWEYYVGHTDVLNNEFIENLEPYINKQLNVEEIKCFDPAMGSGHILVYMFELLFEIYSKCGYMEREIPRLIIEKNLFGVDIDDRAYQLACFSVVMKALQYNKRFLRSIDKEGLKLNLVAIQESNILTEEDIAYISGESDGEIFDKVKHYIRQFTDGKIIGSLAEVEGLDHQMLTDRLNYIQDTPTNNLFNEESRRKSLELLPSIIKQAEILSNKFNCTITNPPYIGYKFLNEKLKEFIDRNYPNYGTDLFSVFIKYVQSCTAIDGQIGLVTPYAWMFIKNYEVLRQELIENRTISSLIQLEPNAFETAAVPVCTFTLRNYKVDYPGEYIRLHDFKGINIQEIKVKEAISNPNVKYRFTISDKVFEKIPGKRYAFWISEKFRELFAKSKVLDDFIEISGSQNITGNNKRYLRNFWEVEYQKIKEKRWSLYSKGGDYRKWYGNIELVVDWSEEARLFYKNNPTSNLLNERYWHKEGITYNGISLRGFTVRWVNDVIYDKGGPTFHVNDKDLQYYIIAFLNTKIAATIINIFNPTPNTQVNDIKFIPFILTDNEAWKKEIIYLAKECIDLAKEDWDFYENSYDYKNSPLIKFKSDSGLIQDAYNNWAEFKNKSFQKLKENEERINKIFIDIYNLNEDFSPEVNNEDIILTRPDEEKDIKNFISYAIGCILGRYSLDYEGIIYSGGQFDLEKYRTFSASRDGIIPVVQDEYLEDNIVGKVVDFIRVVYGEENLDKNLEYVAKVLGKTENETPREKIKKYFLLDFYNDHIGIYNTRGRKAPIYWFITSGKQKAFNCLIYIHRYDKSTLSKIRTDYLHEYQVKLEFEKSNLLSIIDGESTTKEINQAKKELKIVDKKIEELKDFDERLHNIADMQIEIDLNNGVVDNYTKFKGFVLPIK